MNSDPAKNLLVLRFSSLGDLGLLYPALVTFLEQHSNYTLILVTKKEFAPLFKGVERLIIYPVDTRKFIGVIGLLKLSSLLANNFSFNTVIDAHKVIRTSLLSFFLKLKGKRVFRLDKLRSDRKKLVRKRNKVYKPLTHATERYLDIFRRAGFPVSLKQGPYLAEEQIPLINSFLDKVKMENEQKLLGIAPFAKWDTKVLPLYKMEQLLSRLNSSNKFQIILFGGPEDRKQFQPWKEKFSNVHYPEGAGNLFDEVQLMKKLSLMVSMDSANMHLAALAGIPVLTIWGPTHRFAGFAAVNSREDWHIEVPVNELGCRPCSAFGDTPCWRGDHACMNLIDIDAVFTEIVRLTNST